ncbi:ETC complex I subunit [Oricola cellulosilytica]|uniref:ETC complex I subunit n=1 Tax=Oricola cellulosilytica TaxID=1429082 RepID=A0A4R0PEE4_9HYPH|nr:ETC complex I subunit [Oricola cellulosilytica]TCD14565.1 ETC complex I subunit [Oricola cellulosilytica]
MSARIYSPSKTPMQSGKAKTDYWVLEFDRATARTIDPLMGYTSSSDPLAQVSLRFDTQEAAVAYARKNGIAFRIEEKTDPKRRAMAYSDNFKFNRKTPWTH